MAEKASAVPKPAVKLPDLIPRKDACGGTGLHWHEPPLPIPPPGFIKRSDENSESSDR